MDNNNYVALYRKWRPKTFSDVKGQEHIVTTLRNQIMSKRTSHAYLFCGTRGTGKTSVAKILARAVNCENPVDGSPCCECASCRAIESGSSLNVIEIDAASNNGVDNIRQIREEVEYRPTEGKYKVYIIDEVHMLSTGAFNALLKTLEEPPEYVMFILATTESHKIPVTIASRCQRYDFRRISTEVIQDRIRELTKVEEVSIEDEAIAYIARLSDGAMRDALSLLDRCVSCGKKDGGISYEEVLDILGAVDTRIFSELFRQVVNRDVPGIIGLLDEVIAKGRDLTQFVSDFTWYIRNILMVKAQGGETKNLDMSLENAKRIKEESFMSEEEALMRYLRIMSELCSGLRNATQKRVLTELAFIKLTRPQMETDMQSITERLRRIEELVGEKEELLKLTEIRPAQVVYKEAVNLADNTVKKVFEVKAESEDIKKVAEGFRGIIGRCPEIFKPFLTEAHVHEENGDCVLVFNLEFACQYITQEENLSVIKGVIEETIGKSINLRTHLVDNQTKIIDKRDTDSEFYKDMEMVNE